MKLLSRVRSGDIYIHMAENMPARQYLDIGKLPVGISSPIIHLSSFKTVQIKIRDPSGTGYLKKVRRLDTTAFQGTVVLDCDLTVPPGAEPGKIAKSCFNTGGEGDKSIPKKPKLSTVYVMLIAGVGCAILVVLAVFGARKCKSKKSSYEAVLESCE